MSKIKTLMLDVMSKYKTKLYNYHEDNYFVVFDTLRMKFTFFSVNDGFYDPLRKYYKQSTAFDIVTELNSRLGELDDK